MSEDSVPLLFLVGKHSFAASVEHHSTRILDVLNDAESTLLRVKNAVVFPGFDVFPGTDVFPGQRGAPIAECAEATIQKSAVDCVILTDERHEAPVRRKYALRDKQSHKVFVLLGNIEIRGTAMLERSVDADLLLGNRASAFFPVVSASVTSAGGPPLAAQVAFVNKQKVSLIEIDKRTVVPA